MQQQDYVKLPSLIYHQDRRVELNLLDDMYAGRKNLITKEQLHDFYLTHWRMFPYSNRQMHIEQKPEEMFPGDQEDLFSCSKVGKPALILISVEIRLHDLVQETLKNNPLLKKIADPKLQPIVYKQVLPKTLFFNSRFESGNLREVEKVSESEYNLFLSFDHNTLNYTQWFYFSVRNIAKDVTVKFNIKNLQKDESTYNIGNLPFVYSTRHNKQNGTNEWVRDGFDIEYFRGKHSTVDRESAVSTYLQYFYLA